MNGIVSYELDPETDDDRHVIEIMKSKGKVTMRQSKKGGLVFDMEKAEGQAAGASIVPDETGTDLSGVQRTAKP